jgi:hypothetical protein
MLLPNGITATEGVSKQNAQKMFGYKQGERNGKFRILREREIFTCLHRPDNIIRIVKHRKLCQVRNNG